MSRSNYDVKETYTGTGSLDTYSFDFKITNPLHILIVESDTDGNETQRVRGDDVTYLADLLFDENNGGGEVVLAANLASGYTLKLFLADDEPTQPYEFSNKRTFNLKRIEDAYDNVMGAIQRLVFKSKQSIRISDLDDESTFNTQLPSLVGQGGKAIVVNDTETGLKFATAGSGGAGGDVEFVEFNGPISGTLQKNEIGIIKSGASFALTLGNIDQVAGDVIEVKFLGFSGPLTVQPTGANIDGVASKIYAGSINAAYKFRFTGTEWIYT